MRPSAIVLASTAAGAAAAVALALPGVAASPRAEIGMTLLQQMPALAVAALGVYGLVALSLTTTSLVAGVVRVHQDLARAASGRAIVRRDWTAMLAGTGFRRPAAVAPGGAGPEDGSDAAQGGFSVNEARAGIARHHYISLARSHFFSVLIVLVGIVALGAAQDLGTLPFRIGTIPTVSVILIVVGLLLLAVLGRIAVDVAGEPLLETIAQSPGEPVEVGLLRRVVVLQEAARDGETRDARIADFPDGFLEQLGAAFEQGHRAILDAVTALSQNSRALEAAMRSALDAIAAQQRAVDNNLPVLATLPDLQAAVEELTAVLRQLTAAPGRTEEAPFTAAPPRRSPPTPGLARELGRLMQEIDAAR